MFGVHFGNMYLEKVFEYVLGKPLENESLDESFLGHYYQLLRVDTFKGDTPMSPWKSLDPKSEITKSEDQIPNLTVSSVDSVNQVVIKR